MALPAVDTFTATTNAPLQTYSSNWTISAGAFAVDATADAVYTAGLAADCIAFWNADTFANNQYAQATLITSNVTAAIGVAVRCSAGGNGYGLYYQYSGQWLWLWKMVNNVWTELVGANNIGAYGDGDVLRLEVNGTTLTAKINGNVVPGFAAVTDTSLSSGRAGISGYDSNSNCRMTAWEGGNLGGSAVNLAANGITTGAPSVAAATIGQKHALTANGITTGAPVVGTAGMTGSALLTALGITTGAPSVATATLGQIHAITATGVTTGAPALGTPIALPLQGATIGGVLTVDLTNGRYFRNASGIVLLSGFHTWYEFQDGGLSYPPPAFDYGAWLDYVDMRGGNLHKLWVLETARGWSDADAYFSPLPWQRTGPGNANDGRPKFDLTQFSQAYFDRLRERAILAGNRGHYVVVQLFQGWNITAKGFGNYPFTYHPLNGPNNINGIDGDVDNDNEGEETRNLANTAIISIQQAYVEKVVDTLNDLDNVLWEVSNEEDGNTTTDAWQDHWIDFLHTYEAGKAKQHPVGYTVAFPNGSDTDLTSSNADWISPNNSNSMTPGTAAGDKIVLWDTDHIVGLTTEYKWVWQSFLRGCNPIYMDAYDGALYGADMRADAAHEKIRYNLGYVRDLAAQLDLANMTPQNSLASTGYCLAKMSGQAQVVAYQHTSGSFTVNLTGVSGVFAVQWLRTLNGATQAGSNVNGGAVRTLTPPWAGEDAVAFLEKIGADLTAGNITAGAPSVGTATIGQVHVLAANGVTAGAPSVATATPGQVHALAAAGITAGAPAAGAATLGQTHVLAAVAVSTVAPALGQPTVAHIHMLAAATFAAGAPVLGQPQIGQAHALATGEMAAGAPALGQPTATHVHVLAAVAVTAGQPTAGAASIGQAHALVISGIVTGAPTLGSPGMAGEIALSPLDINTGAPALGFPSLGQRHALAAAGVTAGAPLAGQTTINQVHALAATGVAAGQPAAAAPQIGQAHVLAAEDIVAGAPALGQPSTGGAIALAALGVTAGQPAPGSPALGQTHVLGAANATAGAPSAGAPAVGQVHVLAALWLATAAPVLGRPGLNRSSVQTPPERTLVVWFEERSMTVEMDNRSVTVKSGG